MRWINDCEQELIFQKRNFFLAKQQLWPPFQIAAFFEKKNDKTSRTTIIVICAVAGINNRYVCFKIIIDVFKGMNE